MRIRKIKSTKNEYVYAGGSWVRNFTKTGIKPVDLSKLFRPDDYNLIVSNEFASETFGVSNIADDNFNFSKVIIVSDGYDFEKRQQLAAKIEGSVVLAVNGALKRWQLFDNNRILVKPINFYIVNNPYAECMYFMPSVYFPSCIMSSRTKPEFIRNYIGMKYLYSPTPNIQFGIHKNVVKYTVDDYRNPICAAINLAFRFKAKKILLLCCDDSLPVQKPGTVLLENGLWTYPHHMRSHDIIDANLFWITREEIGIQIADYSSGPKYVNAEYIKTEEEAIDFFQREE